MFLVFKVGGYGYDMVFLQGLCIFTGYYGCRMYELKCDDGSFLWLYQLSVEILCYRLAAHLLLVCLKLDSPCLPLQYRLLDIAT